MLLLAVHFVVLYSIGRADQQLPSGTFVFGYGSQLSLRQGEQLDLHLNSNAGRVSLAVDRLGLHTQRVLEQAEVRVDLHPIPDRASSHGLRLAHGLSFENSRGLVQRVLPSNSGGRARRLARPLRPCFFVVRPAHPGRRSKILLQLATNTYNAYTNWGGHSLYGYHDRDGIQGHRVSFDRPISSQFDRWGNPLREMGGSKRL